MNRFCVKNPAPRKVTYAHQAERTGRRLFCTTLAVVCTSLLGRANATSAETDIRQIEADISRAYAANDLPRYFAFYANDLRALFPDGPTNLAQYRKEWTDFIKGGGAVLSFTYTDMVVQVSPSGDAAVVSHRAKARTRDARGKVSDDNYLETDVLFRRREEWKIAEIHYSVAASEGK